MVRRSHERCAPLPTTAQPSQQLRNRVTHASMSLAATPAGRVTDRLIQYHANRAPFGEDADNVRIGKRRCTQTADTLTAAGHTSSLEGTGVRCGKDCSSRGGMKHSTDGTFGAALPTRQAPNVPVSQRAR